MNVISKPIRAGKTHEAMLRCCEGGMKLVCASEVEARRVNNLAKDNPLFKRFPGAISMHNSRERLAGSKNKKVIVDNADWVLSSFLGVEVQWITLNGPIEINGNKAEFEKSAPAVSANSSNYAKCADEVLSIIKYSHNSSHGRKIIECIKRHFTQHKSKPVTIQQYGKDFM